uniref:Secreted protein n=1 Tax=Ascaris lumbricoides TaxID=6252 RepID=A0A0M3I521_ASCLU
MWGRANHACQTGSEALNCVNDTRQSNATNVFDAETGGKPKRQPERKGTASKHMEGTAMGDDGTYWQFFLATGVFSAQLLVIS